MHVPTPATDPLAPGDLRDALGEVLASAVDARRALTLVMAEARGVGQSAAAAKLCDVLRPMVRETDVLWRTGFDSVAMVLVDADGPSGEHAVSRIRAAVANTTRLGLALGRATAAPGIGASDLIDLARANLLGLRR